MPLTTDQVTREDGQLSDGLSAALDEHLKDNFGELLPHVFFGDVTRRLVALSEDGSDLAHAELDRVLAFLEDRFDEGDEQIQELIAVSLLENLPRPGESGVGIRRSLGPGLRAELDRLES